MMWFIGFLIRLYFKILKLGFMVLILFVGVFFLSALLTPIQEPQLYGVTFTPGTAEYYNLDWKKTYRSIFEELGIKHVRIGAYWNEIERADGFFDFERLDYQVREAERLGGKLIVVVGRKVPRWPECHIPDWALKLPLEAQDKAVLEYVEEVIQRYKSSPAIEYWQVENEPFLPFGICPDFTTQFVDREIALVRSIDSRPILVTDSGELSIWIRAANRGDIFGTTMYRRVYNKYFGEFTYPLPPSFFRAKRTITELFVGKKPMIVIELQGEPWLAKPISQSTIEEQFGVMSPDYFEDTLRYASKTGFGTFYLWGVEWWFWMREQGHPEFINSMKDKVEALGRG